jgi:branched-chain amino acid aminotransferase
MKVWINGRIVSEAEASVSVLDHGLLYGDGIFEGIRVRLGRVLDLERHLERLERSARSVYLELPLSRSTLGGIVLETLAALGRPEAYVRLLVTRGKGLLGLDPISCPKPEVIVIADSLSLYDPERYRVGLRLLTASWRRPDPDVLDPSVKSLNYLNNVLNRCEARQRGGDEALVLNRRGTVAEASGANVFVRTGTVLMTPPVLDGALPGITRGRVLGLAAELGLQASERSLARADVLAADEVFLTGSGAGLVPVASLDGQVVGPRDANGALLNPVLPAFGEAMDAYARRRGTPIAGVPLL